MDESKLDEKLKAVLNALCPEVKEALMTFASHVGGCERCRLVLVGYGAPLYIESLDWANKQREALTRISLGIETINTLLSAIKPTEV